MYIWRNKNRRDKRHHLQLGEQAWTASSEDKDHRVEDELLRQRLEENHLMYFRGRTHSLMSAFLGMTDAKDLVASTRSSSSSSSSRILSPGDREVEVLRKELEIFRRNQESFLHKEERLRHEAEEMRSHLKLLFRKFGDQEYEEIDRSGLVKLLEYMQVSMNQKQFEEYCEKCGFDESRQSITFDEFYSEFLGELQDREKKSMWPKFSLFASSRKKLFSQEDLDTEESETRQGVSISRHLEIRMKIMEAKTLLIDHAVYRAVEDARREFRKAHPPLFQCLECYQTFTLDEDLIVHRKDTEYHKQFVQERIQCEDKYIFVDKMLSGDLGRTFRAQRLIFSEELGSLQSRIDGAFEQPFRPYLADKDGKRHRQMLRGMFVTGFDPKSGVRPNYKRNGLVGQHLAPLRIAPNSNFIYKPMPPELKDVLLDLMRCQDEFIDTVSTQDHPNAAVMIQENGECNLALVRFEWNGYAEKNVSIRGEFTGWKYQEMPCDTFSNKFFFMVELSPGKYRYRFMVDGVEKVDELASKADDAESPLGKSNEILVTKSSIYHVPREEKLRGGGNRRKSKLRPETEKLGDDDDAGSIVSRVTDATLGLAAKERGTLRSRTASAESAATSHSAKPKTPGFITHISKTDKGGLIHKVENLNLRNLALCDDGVNAIVCNLHKNGFILTIDLSYNSISDEGMQALSGALPKLTALRELKLNGNGFAYDSCRYLVEALKTAESIQTLELSNNRIGDDGFETICEFLRYNMSIKSIFVDQNLIGDDGFECFAELLMVNRTLTHCSCGSNRMTQKSIEKICASLKNNASLTSLNISHNQIGADGANDIGDLLFFTTTIAKLDLVHIDLFSHRSQRGFHAICYGLKHNKSLTSLNLQNNGINDYHVDFIAHALTLNENIQYLDLQFNKTKKEWYMMDLMVPTHMHQDMPSVETSLRNNRNAAKRREGAYTHDPKRFIVDDVVRGVWNNRREWRQVVISEVERQERKLKIAKEYQRMQVENDFIRDQVNLVMNGIRLYLDEVPCRNYILTTAKFISQYLHDLARFDPLEHHLESMQADAESGRLSQQGKSGKTRAKSIALKQAKATSGLSSKHSSNDFEDKYTDDNNDRKKSFLSLDGLLDRVSNLTASPIEIESFMHAHVTTINAIFSVVEGASNLLLHPERIVSAMQMLALPLQESEVQDAVDASLVKGVHMLALHKFSEYILRNAKRISGDNKLQRLRMLADLMVNPPIEEAKSIILDHIHHSVFLDARHKFRLVPENLPKYCCSVCQRRFASEGLFKKHMKRGARNPYHKRMRMKESIHHSQTMFLNEVKAACTGVYFPAYYELMPPNRLPKDYCPQVFDLMGSRGRPFAVVEEFRTVRALDVLGDFLLVSHSAIPGWIRFRQGRQMFLRPIEGFDWDSLHIQDGISYYRVNDNLPGEIELKVRHRPSLDAEVVGYVKKGQIIQVMAVIMDWIQVKHGQEDAAWLLIRSPLLKPARSEPGNHPRIAPTLDGGGIRTPTASPVRRRNVDRTCTPLDHVDADEDLIFKDHIISYEVNGKKFRNNTEKNPSITKYKIEVFDDIRYGSAEKGTSSDHLLPLPSFIQKRIVPDIENLPPTPCDLSQQSIFDIIVACNESEIREWDLEINGGFSADMAMHPFGKSMRDDVYKVEDEEDQEIEFEN